MDTNFQALKDALAANARRAKDSIIMPDIDKINECRALIKAAAQAVITMKHEGFTGGYSSQETVNEAETNVMLAYRHLEDASMRLGKAIQALDGGVSVYDKKTTVGA